MRRRRCFLPAVVSLERLVAPAPFIPPPYDQPPSSVTYAPPPAPTFTNPPAVTVGSTWGVSPYSTSTVTTTD